MLVCTVSGLTLLYLSAMPATAGWLHRRLAKENPLDVPPAAVQAIVVLGGGRRPDTPELGGDTLAANSLERIRYAALLHKRTGLPLMVSGGSAQGRCPSEAELMAAALVHEFGVPVRWMESNSRNTLENARFSAEILRSQRIRTIALVTHALHMARAVGSFRRCGIEVVPAPMGYYLPSPGRQGLGYWIPSPASVCQSAHALHEILGRIAYRWRAS